MLRSENYLVVLPILIGSLRYVNISINLTAVYLLTIIAYIYSCKKLHIQIIYLTLAFVPFCVYSLIFIIYNGSAIDHNIISYYLYSVFVPVAFFTYVKKISIHKDHTNYEGCMLFLIIFSIFVLLYSEGRQFYRGSVYQFSGDWLLLFLFLLVITRQLTVILMCLILALLIITGSRAAFLVSLVIILPQLLRPRLLLPALIALILIHFLDFTFLFNHIKLRVLIDIVGILKADPITTIMRGVDDRFIFHQAAMTEFYQNPIWGSYGYASKGQYAHSFANILASWGIVGTFMFCLPFLLLALSRTAGIPTIIWVFTILLTYSLFRTPDSFFYPGMTAITFAYGMYISRNRAFEDAS